MCGYMHKDDPSTQRIFIVYSSPIPYQNIRAAIKSQGGASEMPSDLEIIELNKEWRPRASPSLVERTEGLSSIGQIG